MLKSLKWLLFVILSWSQISCAPTPPDVPACEHMAQRLSTDPVTNHLILSPSPTCMKQIGEVECGHCVYIMSGNEKFFGEKPQNWFNGKPWSAIKLTGIILPVKESYAPIDTYMINSCKQMNCSEDVDKFKIKLNSLSVLAR